MFTEQFKIILWKNWKIFRKRSSFFSCAFEIFFTFLIIDFLSLRNHEKKLFNKIPSNIPVDISINFAQYYANEGRFGSIAFVLPESNTTSIDSDTFISYVMNDPILKTAEGLTYKKYNNEIELENYVYSDDKDSILCGVVFNNNDYTDYTIRIKGSKIVNSKEDPIMNYAVARRMELPDSYVSFTGHEVEGDKYKSLFIIVQMAVDNAIIQMKTNRSVNGLSVLLGKFSKPEIFYDSNIMSKNGREFDGMAPYLLLLCIGQFFHINNRLMDEVEDGTKEGLLSIGTNPIHLWFTWEIIYLPLSLVAFLLFMAFDASNVFFAINPIIYILYYTFYTISMYNIAVIFSLIIKKAKTVLAFVCMFVASTMTVNKYMFELKISGKGHIEKIFSAIFSPIGMAMGSEEIIHASDMDQYIGFSNLFKTDFGFYFMWVFIDMIAYFLIAVTLEWLRKIDMRSFGVRLKNINKNLDKASLHEDDIQEDPTDAECYVHVKNLYKYFKFRRNIGNDRDVNDEDLGKLFAANNNISFKVYKDEIFAILGHNGAGKSTLIQNMTGIIKPDYGETYYRGLPFSRHKKEIRRDFGICLQSNILIKGFTVEEHFILHSGIKGVTNTDFETWINEIGLVGKEHYEVQKMSGGQKRKLCIGLALIGNPKYVFLDEPTTGLDPLSRRKIWNLLLKIKKDRVIFITTHYMDEADIIADRKLILNKGNIRCLGSSVYLKNHFKMKYGLEVETDNVTAVNQLIQQYIPEATYYHGKTNVSDGRTEARNPNETLIDVTDNDNDNDNNNNKIHSNTSALTHTWKLPVMSSNSFSALLSCLENERGHLLKNFSLNAPILEELFVSLEREAEMKRRMREGRMDQLESDKIIELPKVDNIKRPNAFVTALRLWRYRNRVYKRQKTYWFIGILVPVLVLFVFIPILNEQLHVLKFNNYERRELSSSIYANQQWNYDVKESSGIVNTITQSMVQQELSENASQNQTLNFKPIADVNEESLLITKEPYYVSSFSGKTINNTYQFTVYYNDSLVHSLPATINVLSNVVLSSNHVNEAIHVNSYPFNYFDDKSISSMKLFATLIITFCFAFPLSFYGTNVVRERVQNLLKQLQLNGIPNKSYWLSVLISDHFIFMITCFFFVITFILCNFSPYFHGTILGMLFLFIYFCSIACLLFQYCVSYIFETENNAYLIFFLLNIVPPYMICIKAFTENLETDMVAQLDVQIYLAVLIYILGAIFPSYSFVKVFRSLINIGIKHNAIGIDISFRSILQVRYQISTCILASLTAIGVYGYVLYTLTKKRYDPKRKIMMTTDAIKEKYDREIKTFDEDIQKEYDDVVHDTENKIPIKIIKLSKEYDELKFSTKEEIHESMHRVNPKYGEAHMSDLGLGRVVVTPFENITLGVRKCECFGILGPNGSGKSSLLNTTSFTFPQTVGKIYYDGKDTTERVGNEIALGYCPQEDTLWNEFTLFEHIEMFLYLRGYSRKKAKRMAKQLIRFCHLTDHKNKMPYELSGGTRRKLNILIALCCSPSKIIMDEPSAGMDPSTRRYIWDIIKNALQSSGSSIIMSTHSMEEAELLCNRITIMIKGRLKCIGTPEHLKMKYGNTYILDVHTTDVKKFHDQIVVEGELFGTSDYTREDKSSHRVKYEVKGHHKISQVFEIMEKCRNKGLITDYSYSQTSLEQVFLNFATDAFQED